MDMKDRNQRQCKKPFGNWGEEGRGKKKVWEGGGCVGEGCTQNMQAGKGLGGTSWGTYPKSAMKEIQNGEAKANLEEQRTDLGSLDILRE